MTNLGKSDHRFPVENHDDIRRSRNQVRCDRYPCISIYLRHTRQCLVKKNRKETKGQPMIALYNCAMIKLIKFLKIDVYILFPLFLFSEIEQLMQL